LRDPERFALQQDNDWGGHGLIWPEGLGLGADKPQLFREAWRVLKPEWPT